VDKEAFAAQQHEVLGYLASFLFHGQMSVAEMCDGLQRV